MAPFKLPLFYAVNLFILSRLFDESFKLFGLIDGYISENFTIQLDTGQLETVYKFTVISTVDTAGSVNPDSPETTV